MTPDLSDSVLGVIIESIRLRKHLHTGDLSGVKSLLQFRKTVDVGEIDVETTVHKILIILEGGMVGRDAEPGKDRHLSLRERFLGA